MRCVTVPLIEVTVIAAAGCAAQLVILAAACCAIVIVCTSAIVLVPVALRAIVMPVAGKRALVPTVIRAVTAATLKVTTNGPPIGPVTRTPPAVVIEARALSAAASVSGSTFQGSAGVVLAPKVRVKLPLLGAFVIGPTETTIAAADRST